MGERLQDERLEELRRQGKKIYSISRLNCLNQCAYQAYLNYIKEEPEEQNIWSILGGRTHDAIQQCIDTNCDTSIIKTAILDELNDLDLFELSFPKDRNGNETIKNNWIANMTRFADEFKRPKGTFITEELVLYKIDDEHYMQGYIDAQRINSDGSLWIIDWKTSSNFDKAHLKEAGRQLILYGLAKQAEGYKVDNISWCMLKYYEATWTQKNGKDKSKVGEWRNLIKDLSNAIKQKLEINGYDEITIDLLLENASQTNQIPKEIRKEFKVLPYVRDYEFSTENIEETLSYIKEKIEQYEQAGDDEEKYPPCDIAKQSFFCSSLCGHKEQCKYWHDYCEQYNESSNDEDLF